MSSFVSSYFATQPIGNPRLEDRLFSMDTNQSAVPRTKVDTTRPDFTGEINHTAHTSFRWARVTMSSSEKVTEKLRENDKPPAYPVTRRRVTHFFSLFSCLPPLHFAFPPFPSAMLRLSSSSGLARSLSSPSASHPRHVFTVFHPPPPRFLQLLFANSSKDSKR